MRNTRVFTEANFAKLSTIMNEHKISAGGHLFWEGDSSDRLHYIVKGRVNLTKANTEGKHFVLYRFQDGDLIGHLDPDPQATQGFNAIAVSDCVIGAIAKQELDLLLWQNGDLALEFMKWIGLMHRLTQSKFRDLMLYGKQGALCSTLIRLTNSFGRPREDGIVITEKMTNNELADYIGAARESVNRMLGELRKAGVISIDNGIIVVHDIDYLRKTCNCDQCPKEICRI